jgi:hypothetical protein
MKKASMLLLPLLILAAFVMVNCTDGDPNTESGTYSNPTKITQDWQIFYLRVVDASRPEGMRNLSGFLRMHFHFNLDEDGDQGIEIQKIFTSSTRSATIPANATLVVDYTLENPNVSTFDPSFDQPITTAPGVGTSNGRMSTGVLNETAQGIDAEGYRYLGNVGSSAFETAVYIGFVMRNVSASATAERISIGVTDGAVQSGPDGGRRIAPLWMWLNLDYDFDPPEIPPEGPVVVQNWTKVYFPIPEAANILSLHVDDGSVEIQRIFVLDDNLEEINIFDFTASDILAGTIWWEDNENPMAGFVDDGVYILESDSYKPGGRFGSGLIVDNDYIGFVIRSTKGLGDARFLLETEGSPGASVTVRFDNMYREGMIPGGIDFTQWVLAWMETGDGVEHALHANNGYIEIQKIYINNSATLTGATILFDFTKPAVLPDEVTGIPYWWENFFGRVVDGKVVHEAFGDYEYGGGFATPTKFTHIGFVVRTNTLGKGGFGDIRYNAGGPEVLFVNMDIEVLD